MKVIIRTLSLEGDSTKVLEGKSAIWKEVEEILSEPGRFVAVENQVVFDVDAAKERILSVKGRVAEILIGSQVGGG